MDDKMFQNEANYASVPLKSYDETQKNEDELPPPYEYPKIDVSGGWKDRPFAIVFCIHVIVVILLACILGIPAVISHIDQLGFGSLQQVSLKFDVKPFIWGLLVSIGVGITGSLLIFFFLRACTNQVIKCTFLMVILFEVLLCVILGFVFWPLCFIPGTFLLITLICLGCIRKRIEFGEAHLSAGCAALNAHPSSVAITVIMLIVELLWFVFWFLMVFGIPLTRTRFLSFASNTSLGNATYKESISMTTNSSLINENQIRINGSKVFITDRRLVNETFSPANARIQRKQLTPGSNSTSKGVYNGYVDNIIAFLLFLSWYWGSITFANIAHFVTACSVAHWWFEGETKRQYGFRNSVKRALTTNLGTICFGSIIEAIIKSARSTENRKSQKGLLSCIMLCILAILEKVVGYLNEWAFIFSALTGQGFVQSSKNFIELFKKRGWTAILNDTVIGTTLGFVNIGVGLGSAVAGAAFTYLIASGKPEQIPATVFIGCFGFLISLFMSAIVTTVLTSCVRTIFVCFALNSSSLGATHPDHLERLTKVWHKFYPQEFANSGHAQQNVEQTA